MSNYPLYPIDNLNCDVLSWFASPVYVEEVNGYYVILARNLIDNNKFYLVHSSLLNQPKVRECFTSLMTNTGVLKVIGYHQSTLKTQLGMNNVIKCFLPLAEKAQPNAMPKDFLAMGVRNINKLQNSYIRYYSTPAQEKVMKSKLVNYLGKINQYLGDRQQVNVMECERDVRDANETVPFPMIIYHLYAEGMIKINGQTISLP